MAKSGSVGRVGTALIRGTKAVAAKPVQPVLRFLSESRPLITGVDRTVASLTRDEVVNAVGDLVTGKLDTLMVDFAGGATRADVVMGLAGIGDPDVFLPSVAEDLLDHSALLDGTAPLSALLGDDWLGSEHPIMISKEERTQRLVEGLATAIGQARANGLDPGELFDPPMLTFTVRYLRSHIMRNGWDHGNWSELVGAAVFNRLPLLRPPTHQMVLPKLKPPFSPGLGYDTVLSDAALAFGHQTKALSFARAALGGSVSIRKIGNRVDSVVGSPILSQKMSDGIRNRLWNHQIPGSGILRPYPSTVAAGTAGWQMVSPVSIWRLDTPYLTETAYEAVSNAQFRAGSAVARIADLDLPASVKTQLRAIIGGPNVVWNTPREEFEQLTTAWLDRNIQGWEDALNAKLRTKKLNGLIKHPAGKPEVRIYASHQASRFNDILRMLALI